MGESDAYWDWRPRGNCSRLSPSNVDKLFFPDSGRSINKAKQFCLGCPVATQCLEYALANNEQGIWAGTSYEDRKRILKFQRDLRGEVTPRKIVARRNFTFS